MMGNLSDKLIAKRELTRHLRELGLLVGRAIGEPELLSLAETRNMRSQANLVVRQPVNVFDIAFEEKRELNFRKFLERLAEANPCDVYVWTPAANLCGLLRPLPLSAFRVEFPFDLNPESIVAILTSDLRDQLLLDFSRNSDGRQRLDVEASGERWGVVAFPDAEGRDALS